MVEFSHGVLDRTTVGVRWETRFPNGTSWCTKEGGERRWTGCWKPTTSQSSLGVSALHPVKELVYWVLLRILLLSRPWSVLSLIKAGKWGGWCQDPLQSALGMNNSPLLLNSHVTTSVFFPAFSPGSLIGDIVVLLVA